MNSTAAPAADIASGEQWGGVECAASGRGAARVEWIRKEARVPSASQPTASLGSRGAECCHTVTERVAVISRSLRGCCTLCARLLTVAHAVWSVSGSSRRAVFPHCSFVATVDSLVHASVASTQEQTRTARRRHVHHHANQDAIVGSRGDGRARAVLTG